MSLETSLWADMIDCFENGTFEQWQKAEARYFRFMEAKDWAWSKSR